MAGVTTWHVDLCTTARPHSSEHLLVATDQLRGRHERRDMKRCRVQLDACCLPVCLEFVMLSA